MSTNAQTELGKHDVERFDETLRQAPKFAEALERVKRLETVLERFETTLKPVDTSTKGKWKSSRMALHCRKPD